MRTFDWLLASLRFHWRMHLYVALGVIAGSAALTGALLVGDSLRGSLRETALARLGNVDTLIRADRTFRSAIAANLSRMTEFSSAGRMVAPAMLLRGSAVHAESSARANRVEILGVEDSFWSVVANETAPESLGGAAVALNRALATQLRASIGDDVLLRFERLADISAETLMGKRDDRIATVRLTVAAILPDDGAGSFAPAPRQQRPLNAFVSLTALQRALALPDRANTLLISRPHRDANRPIAIGELIDRTGGVFSLADYGLTLRASDEHGYISLESDTSLIPPTVATALYSFAQTSHATASGVIGYLANEIRVAGRADAATPYSIVAAAPGDARPLTEIVSPPLRTGEIALSDWAAGDLRATVGDAIEMDYYLAGPHGSIETHTSTFTLRAIVPLAGVAADPGFVPPYKGVTDTEHMSDWDPPFPVNLRKIRDKDEQYWDDHRTTPKAFITLSDGERLWSQHGDRFGTLTSLRLYPQSGRPSEHVAAVARALESALRPSDMGIRVEPARENAITASRGATDFGGLFIGFSLFLITAAAMLVALLFRLGIERRAAEFGTLLAVGFAPRRVFLLLACEGALVALVGSVLGVAAAIAYAEAMLWGLRTLWSAAVNAPFLRFHMTGASIIIGGVAGFAIAAISILIACRGLALRPPRALMAGQVNTPPSAAARLRIPLAVMIAALTFAVGLHVATIAKAVPATLGFFGCAVCYLVAALSLFRATLAFARAAPIGRPGPRAALRMAWRNVCRAPARGTLIVSLLASATFLIVAISAFRLAPDEEAGRKSGGTGGFTLFAESAVPILEDLNTGEMRARIDRAATSRPASSASSAAHIFAFRLRPGDEASCLNLYQRTQPRIIGAIPDFLARGGFRFSAYETSAGMIDNPWQLLLRPLPDGAIPAIGDEAAVKWQLHSGLGKDFVTTDESGAPLRLRFVALLAGSALQDELIISAEQFTRAFPTVSGYGFFLIESADRNPLEFEAQLERGLADYGFDAASTADRLRNYLGVQNTYLATFQMLGGVGLLLGGMGLCAVLLRNLWERRRELALLRAVGYSSKSLRAILTLENVMLVVIGVAAGVIPALITASLADARQATLPLTAIAALLLLVPLLSLLIVRFATKSILDGAIRASLASD